MDLKILAEMAKPDNDLSACEILVLFALAASKYNSSSECSQTVKQLIKIARISTRQFNRAIEGLKDRHIVSVVGKRKTETGACNIYSISFSSIAGGVCATQAQSAGGVCATQAQSAGGVCATQAQSAGGVCATQAQSADGVCATQAQSADGYSGNINSCSKKCVCHNTRARVRPRTHTREGHFVFDVAALSAETNIPSAFVAHCLDEWNRAGWVTAKGNRITGRTIKANLLKFWENERDKAAYMKPAKRARKFRPEDWQLCAETCAHAKAGGGCRCGVAVPPDRDEERPHRPEECARFERKPEAKRGKK